MTRRVYAASHNGQASHFGEKTKLGERAVERVPTRGGFLRSSDRAEPIRLPNASDDGAPSDPLSRLRIVDPESQRAGSFGLTEEDRRTLWAQFAEVHADSQKVFDASLRTLAAGGVGVTVSLAAFVGELGTTGGAAAILFLVCLAANLLSYATAQKDMRARIAGLRDRRDDQIEGTPWTQVTYGFNLLAGASLVAGGALLATFVATSA